MVEDHSGFKLLGDVDVNNKNFTNLVETDWSHDNITAGTIASHDTDTTGAELTSLADNSMADALHRHSELVANDGSPDPALQMDGTGTATITNNLVVSGGTANLGVDDSVQGILNVFGSATGEGGQINLFLAGDQDGVFNSWNIDVGGGDDLRIFKSDASTIHQFLGSGDVILDGKVGIGTTNPATTLHVKDAGAIANLLVESDSSSSDFYLDGHKTSSGNAVNTIYFRNDGDDLARITTVLSGATDAGDLRFLTQPTGGVATIRVTIKTDGKVGIGTATPATSALLDLTSTIGALIVPRMTTTQRNALTAVNGMIMYNTTTNAFNFYENGAWVSGSGLA